MVDPFHNHVRLNSMERSKLLCRLDEDPGHVGRDRRRYKRWEFRMSDIAVLVQHPGGGTGRYLVCARNISAGGLSCIHGGYIHPGSECKVVLPQRDGHPFAVDGIIVYCRHVQGSYHEVGIRFTQEIDPSGLVTPALSDPKTPDDDAPTMPTLEGRVLILDPSPAERALLNYQLSVTGLTLTMVETTGAASDTVRRNTYQLLLCHVPLGDDVIRMIKQIRRAGFKEPIIIMTGESSPTLLAEARAAGANEIVGKPGQPVYLASMIAEWLEVPGVDRPIYSSLEENPGMAELIADYVNEVQTKLRQLEKTKDHQGLTLARTLCLDLLDSGASFGFDPVTEAARDALMAIDTGQSRKDAEAPLQRLIALCRRLRCGTSVRPVGGQKQSA